MLQKKSQFVLVMLLLVAAITRPIWHPQNVHICVCMCVCNCVFIATIHNYRKSFEYDEAHRANKVQSKEHRMPRGSHDGVGERERECMPIKRACVWGEWKRVRERKREQRSMCASLLRMRRRVSRCEERPQEQQQYLTQATFGNNNNKKQFCNCYEIVTKRNAAKILLTLINNNPTQ